MAEKITLDLNIVSETLLIPLWARAVEQQQPEPLLLDPVAEGMLARIDYDFSKFKRARASQVGCCGRAALFDHETRAFLTAHPDAVVVNMGAGLDSRYERLGRPAVSAWYELDLPEVIALRERLLPASGNQYLSASLFDEGWMETVAALDKPTLLLCEGVLMYFEAAEVKDWLQRLARRLPRATLVFDIVPPLLVGKARHHDALQHMAEAPEFKWSVAESRELEGWLPGLKLQKEIGLSALCRTRYPWILGLLYRFAWGRKKFDQRVVRVQLP